MNSIYPKLYSVPILNFRPLACSSNIGLQLECLVSLYSSFFLGMGHIELDLLLVIDRNYVCSCHSRLLETKHAHASVKISNFIFYFYEDKDQNNDTGEFLAITFEIKKNLNSKTLLSSFTYISFELHGTIPKFHLH